MLTLLPVHIANRKMYLVPLRALHAIHAIHVILAHHRPLLPCLVSSPLAMPTVPTMANLPRTRL